MADDDGIASRIADQLRNIGGGAAARVGLSVDVSQIKNLNTELKKLSQNLDEIKKRLPALIKQMNDFGIASGTLSAGVGGVSGTKDPVARAVQQSKVSKRAQQDALGIPTEAGEGGGGGGNRSRLAAFASTPRGQAAVSLGAYAISTLAPAISTLDKRIDRGATYALSADRLSVLYQQMSGLSQQAAQDRYRQPLTGYRLGAGGINTLLSLQAETGITAGKQAPSVEALRAISGYTLSAGDTANMMGALARPETVNRMFMMTGQSFYGFGGRERPTMDVIKSLVNTMGLTDKKVVDSAFQPGSITRARLKSAGVPEDMITTVLQYARENITFKEKGGRGMYDPSNKEQRKKLGIEDNFATQFEETTRVRETREEQFYSRQADNLADMEKATQKVTKALGALEDKLSGLVGARASTRGYQRVLGTLLQVAGTGIAIAGALPTAGGSIAGGAALAATGAALKGTGDGEFDSGTRSSKNSSAKTSGGAKPKTTNIPKRLLSGKYRNLKPQFAERLYAMLKDNNRVHIGQGYRSSKEQESLFFRRYERTNEKTDLYWDGSYWKHVRGAAAAPPGRSMHEIGLAADLTGDLDWVQKNAHKYGLKTFANVNNEPWHVQPAELPNSRRMYEKKGSPWGGDPTGAKHDDDREPEQSKLPETSNDNSDNDYGSTSPPRVPPTDNIPNRPGAPSANSGIDVLNSGTTMEQKLRGSSKSRSGSFLVQRYSGMSISDVLSNVRSTVLSSSPYIGRSKLSSSDNIGDGSFYTGTTSSTMEAPAITVPSTTTNSGSSVVNHTEMGGDTFNIAPIINIGGQSGSVNMSDIRKLAKEVGKLIEEEARMRTARRN